MPQKKALQRNLSHWAWSYSIIRPILVILAFAIFLCLVQRLTFLLRFPPFQRSAIWIPGAVILTALLIAPGRRWWLYYIGLNLATVGAFFDDRAIPLSTVMFAVHFLFAGTALGAGCIKRYWLDSSLENPRTFLMFVVFAVFVVPLSVEAPQAMIRFASGASEVPAVALRNVLGIALGMLIGTPALLLTLTRKRVWWRQTSWSRCAELGTLAICLVVVGNICFESTVGSGASPALLYAPLPLLLWAGTRFGLEGTSWALLVVSFQAIWGALHGHGPFTTSDPAANVFQLQLFILAVSIPLMFLAVVMEERRKAFTALYFETDERKRADERFRLVIECAPIAMIMVDAKGTIVLTNSHADASFGYRREDLRGQSIELLIPERFRARHVEHRAGFFASPESRSMGAGRELFGRRKGGGEFPIEVGLTPIRTSEGIFCLSSVVDISERKRAEEARSELSHAARLAMVGELSASIAHEINQPLGAILSNADAAEMLLDSAPESLAEVRQILDDIRKDDLRASAVIRRLRQLARRRDLETQPLNLNEVIQDTIVLMQGELNRRGVSIETDLAEGLPSVLGDKVHLQQVVLNLLLNGVEAMKELATSRRLTVRTTLNRADFIETAVSDSGPGIRRDRMSRLFDSFFSTKKDGMGIGLSISRSLVEANGGRIWAENNAEGGATFRFTVPVMVHEPGPERSRHDHLPLESMT